MYPLELVNPMKAELIEVGFEDVTTAERVDELVNTPGTLLVVINSVCGCAARNARPAARAAANFTGAKPDKLATVFAGVDSQAVAKVREYSLPYPPSSPSMALFKNGELVHFIERHHIEGRTAEMISEHLAMSFDEFCN